MALAPALVLLIACGGPSRQKDSQLACDQFRILVAEGVGGLLRDPEVRERVRPIYDDAAIATRDVRRAAKDMLRTTTRDDWAGFELAAQEMDRACSDAGF